MVKEQPAGAKRGRVKRDYGFGDDKRSRHLEGLVRIDYKDAEILKKFMTEQGKLMPRRVSGASAKQQRQLKQAIRRARVMGLVR